MTRKGQFNAALGGIAGGGVVALCWLGILSAGFGGSVTQAAWEKIVPLFYLDFFAVNPVGILVSIGMLFGLGLRKKEMPRWASAANLAVTAAAVALLAVGAAITAAG